MKTQLVITDVTRMQEGRVCIAGYDSQGRCIRPVLPPPGIHESSLYAQGRPIIFPFARVEFDLLKQVIELPHTEDWRYDPASVRFVGQLTEQLKREKLDQTISQDVRTIFGAPIISDAGYYLKLGQGSHSLGTVRPMRLIKASHEFSENRWKYRLGFVDFGESTYWLTVTDLTWRFFCDWQRKTGKLPEQITTELTSRLRSVDVYLRIGLARGWKEHPDRCYLQMTGVYTFPDYLEGRTFTDFVGKM